MYKTFIDPVVSSFILLNKSVKDYKKIVNIRACTITSINTGYPSG